MAVIDRLLELNAQVRAANPPVVEEHVNARVARAEADAVVVVTDHDAFDDDTVVARARYVLDTRHRIVGDQVEYLQEMQPSITLVAAARPNFMKVGPVVRALAGRAETTLVHTGQHYDAGMSAVFFEQLKLPPPDVNLGVGSGTHAEQTGAVMVRFEEYLTRTPTDAVVVVGDVNSTLAASLVAAKAGVPVAHVEAGLRSRDWSMPEEINRVVTDRLSRWLLTPSPDADANLAAEGVPADRIHRVGNVMIDTLLANLDEARKRQVTQAADLKLSSDYAVLTLHRPSNVDDPDRLGPLVRAIGKVAADLPVLFPVHPRTRQRLDVVGVPAGLICVDPLPYLDFIGLVAESRLVMTDSGGIQEETSVLGVPCLTLRDNTERPITCELGTNRVIGTDPAAIPPAAQAALGADVKPAAIPLWDGHAGERIADVLVADLA